MSTGDNDKKQPEISTAGFALPTAETTADNNAQTGEIPDPASAAPAEEPAAGFAATAADGNDAPPPAKRWFTKKRLTGIFCAAASMAAGASIGFAAKTCATALLCSAGAPATVTAITAMACAGVLVGAFRAYMNHREEKKIDPSASFWTWKTAKSVGLNAALSVATGSLVMFAGDEIGEIYKRVADVFTGEEAAKIAAQQAALAAAEESLRQAQEQAASLAAQLAEEKAARAAEEAARLAAEETARQAQEQAAALARQLAEEQAARAAEQAARIAAEEAAKQAQEQAAELARQLAEEQAARQAAEAEAARLSEQLRSIETQTPPVVSEEVLPPAEVVTVPAPAFHEVRPGENLWNIVKTHYGLTGNAAIQRMVDAVAVANELAQGTAANNVGIGDQIVLPPRETIEGHTKLALDWRALDAETAARRMASGVRSFAPVMG